MRAFFVALATFAMPLVALAEEHAEPHINWWSWEMHAPPMGWFIVDFVIFAALIVRFTKAPLRKALEERHFSIKKTLEDNAAAFQKAKAQYDESRNKLSVVEREVATLIAKIKDEGGFERERIIAAAREFTTRLRKDSETLVQQEAQAARERLKRSVAERALQEAQRLLVEQLTGKDRERLLDQAITELESTESHPAAQKRRATSTRRAGDTGEVA